ncbi:hypothetical protein ABFS83_10G068300 [Erythranthe nasuta]
MAKSSSTNFFALSFFFLLIIASYEMKAGEAALCQKMSQTWSGTCMNTGHCDRQCKNWENAVHGACHRFSCRCYFNC